MTKSLTTIFESKFSFSSTKIFKLVAHFIDPGQENVGYITISILNEKKTANKLQIHRKISIVHYCRSFNYLPASITSPTTEVSVKPQIGASVGEAISSCRTHKKQSPPPSSLINRPRTPIRRPAGHSTLRHSLPNACWMKVYVAHVYAPMTSY